MHIAICDDDPVFRTELKKIIVNYKINKRIAIDITEFNSGNELLKAKDVFDVVYIDYQMPGIDGLETAKLLRQNNCICSIIFTTSFPQFMIDSFEVQPFRFFIKPIENGIIIKALDDYIKQQKLLNPIVIFCYGEQITIPSEKIIYVEGKGKYSIIRTIDNSYTSSKTLSQIQMLLPKYCFYRIHKSYLVNLYCILKNNDKYLWLINGEKALISRYRLSQFKVDYREFVKNFYVRM